MKFSNLMLFIVIALLLSSSEGYSQVQRMGIPKGVYKIPANSSIRIPSYCLDYTRLQPSSRNIFKHVLKEMLEALVDNADKIFDLQGAIDKGILEITGKKFETEEFIKLLKSSLSQPGLAPDARMQNEKFVKLWETASVNDRKKVKTLVNLNNCINSNFFENTIVPENILYPITKTWTFLPDSVKTLFNEKYDYLLDQMRTQIQEQINDIKDHTSLQFTNKINSDIVLTLKDDIILGETKENCDFLLETLGDIKFTDQSQIWGNQISLLSKILQQSGCVDESSENATLKFLEAVKCFQNKNKLKPSGIIDEQTEKLLYMQYKKQK